MKPELMIHVLVILALAAIPAAADMGLIQADRIDSGVDLGAYSPEAREAARTRLEDTVVAVLVGARHGFIRGERVSLDAGHWRTEATTYKGKVMVPTKFALSAFGIKRLPWFGFRITQRKGFVAIADLAARRGKRVFQDSRGLVIVTDAPMTLTDSELIDSIVTLFDTPEKFADPAVAQRSIPTLRAWGNWKDHVRFTPEQLALYDAPETNWSLISERNYDFTGFNGAELRSVLPTDGVHPRVLFGRDDIPTLTARIQSTPAGRAAWASLADSIQRTWLDPNTSDGVLFRRLAASAPAGLETDGWNLDGQMLGLGPVPIRHVSDGLISLALYSLLAGNEELGHMTATAVASYCQVLAPRVDACSAELSPAGTRWCEMERALGGAELGLCYDLTACWMTGEQRAAVRGLIARAIAGRRSYGQDGSVRVRDTNRVVRELSLFLANVAIEGEQGYDPEIHDRSVETVKAFLQWGISPSGTIYESDAPDHEGLDTLMLAMVAMARRGQNLFGHPHLRCLLGAQIQCTSPSGQLTIPRGSYASGALGIGLLNVLKTFYPNGRGADFLLGHLRHDDGALAVAGLLYTSSWRRVARIDLRLPPDFSDDAAGVFASRSDNTGTAVWLSMQARPDLYVGQTQWPHNAGSFYLEADGVLWAGWQGGYEATGPSGKQSIVFIDGIGQDDGTGLAPPCVEYLGASTSANGAFASANLRYAYEYVWASQIGNWDESLATDHRWEIETDPFVVNVLKGTQPYRINYGSESLATPWFPTLRAEFNPVQYAYRSVGLIRGNHPYVVVADDICKDGRVHQYEWRMMGRHDAQSLAAIEGEELILAAEEGTPQRGTPMLLMCEVGPSQCVLENRGDWTSVSTAAVDPRFRLLLIPYRWGAEVPRTVVDAEAGTVTIRWRDQVDTVSFEVGKDGRTHVTVRRAGKEIVRSR